MILNPAEEPGTQGLYFARLEAFFDEPIGPVTTAALNPDTTALVVDDAASSAAIPNSPPGAASSGHVSAEVFEARQIFNECKLLAG